MRFSHQWRTTCSRSRKSDHATHSHTAVRVAHADEQPSLAQAKGRNQPETYPSRSWSWCLPHVRSNNQQPADGRSMTEGPGAGVTVRVTACLVPSNAARM